LSTRLSGLITDTLPFVFSLVLCIILSPFCCLPVVPPLLDLSAVRLSVWRNGRCGMPTWSPSSRLGVVFGMRCHSFTGGDFDTTLGAKFVITMRYSSCSDESLSSIVEGGEGLVLRQAAQRSQQHRATEADTQWSFWARQESHSILRSLLGEPVLRRPLEQQRVRSVNLVTYSSQVGH
jgi:hypothetical protein